MVSTLTPFANSVYPRARISNCPASMANATGAPMSAAPTGCW